MKFWITRTEHSLRLGETSNEGARIATTELCRLVRYLHDAAPDVDDLVKSTANISGLSEFLAFM